MLRRITALALTFFLAIGAAPAAAGVYELSEDISGGDISTGGHRPSNISGGIDALTSDAEFVRGLYKTLLGREGDPDGFGNWLTALNSGRLSRAQVKNGFLNSNEYYIRSLYKELLNREPDPDGYANWMGHLASGRMSRARIRQAFLDSPEYRGLHGGSSAPPPGPSFASSTGGVADAPAGYNDAEAGGDLYGYNRELFGPVWDIVMKFVEANQAYVYAAGHRNQAGIATTTDCSGFVGSVYHKLAEASGIPAKKDYGNANSYTLSGTQKITSQYPPPNPRDLIKPGDVMVTSGGGHIVMFMGYDRSGNPLIAHSTPGTIKSSAVAGNVGRSGVRIEVMPSYMRTNVSDRYPGQTPFKGVYRINGTEEMLKALASK